MIIILQVLQIIFLAAFFLIVLYVIFIMFSFRNIVPYVPTPRRVIRLMIELGEVKKNDKIVDLGSGTGRIIIEVAKKHRNNLIIGVEKSFILRTVTKFRLLFHPILKKRVQIIKHDFFNLDMFPVNYFIILYIIINCFFTSLEASFL